MINESKKNDERFWNKWKRSGAIGNIRGPDMGEAYAFFDCNASPEEIHEHIPFIRQMVKTPRRLNLLLGEDEGYPLMMEFLFSLTPNSELLGISQEEAGRLYFT